MVKLTASHDKKGGGASTTNQSQCEEVGLGVQTKYNQSQKGHLGTWVTFPAVQWVSCVYWSPLLIYTLCLSHFHRPGVT